MTEVKIFGEHDERTKEQMARCMQYGSVVGGVLCADGHLGYAQPVGGVIAYEEHISVSGVGFDIACGNMAVKLDVPKKAIADRIGPLVERDRRQCQLRPRPQQCGEGRARVVRQPAVAGGGGDRPPQGHGARPARHRRLRQPLRRPVRGRGRPGLDRRAFRLARARAQDRDRLHQGGRAARTASTWRRPCCTRTATSGGNISPA